MVPSEKWKMLFSVVLFIAKVRFDLLFEMN
jgi:hypothetical protein